jgi:thiol-disulfide isomerase/thioredoxin
MSVQQKIALVLALIVLAGIAGAAYKLNSGKIRKVKNSSAINLAEIGVEKDGKPFTRFTTKVTFLQFSTDFCTFCGPTAKMFEALERSDSNVTHLEVNVTNRPDLVSKFNILQTPTTLVLDKDGNIVSRIGGAPKAHELVTEIGHFDI